MDFGKQYEAFLQYLQMNRLDPYEQLLYHTLLMLHFHHDGTEYIEKDNPSLCNLINVSKNTLKKSRDSLKEKKLIDFISGSQKGDMTKYILFQLYKGSSHDPKNEEISFKGSRHDPLVNEKGILGSRDDPKNGILPKKGSPDDPKTVKGSPYDPKNEYSPVKGSPHDPKSGYEHLLGSNCGTLNFFSDVLEYSLKKDDVPEDGIDTQIIDAWE